MSVESVNAPRWAAWWPAVSLAIPMLLASLGVSIANITLPALLKAFPATFADVQWVIIAYLLATTVAIVPSGYLGDLYGRRRVLLAGIALFTIASLACALAPTLPVLIAARAVQGIGAAALSTLTMSLLRDMSMTKSLGASMGILGSMSAIGTTLGPFLGGVAVTSFGWSGAFLILVPPGLLSFLLAMRMVPHSGSNGRGADAKFDFAGAILLAATLTAFAMAMTSSTGLAQQFTMLLIILALAGGGLFVFVETRTRVPLIRLQMLREPSLASGLATNLLVSAVMMTTLIVGPVFLMSGIGLSAVHAGIIMSIGPAASMLSGFVAGYLADRFGPRKMIVAGLAQMGIGAVSLAMLPATFGVAGYAAALVLLTPGYQLYLAANNTAVMAGAAERERGVVSGILNLSRNIGFIAGASGMGAVFALALNTGGAATATAGRVVTASSAAFLLASAIVAAALVITLMARSVSRV
jgi:MFS family permease